MNFLSSLLWYFMVLGLGFSLETLRWGCIPGPWPWAYSLMCLGLEDKPGGIEHLFSEGERKGGRNGERERQGERKWIEWTKPNCIISKLPYCKEENRVTWGWKGLGGYFAIFLSALQKWRGCSFIHWKKFSLSTYSELGTVLDKRGISVKQVLKIYWLLM